MQEMCKRENVFFILFFFYSKRIETDRNIYFFCLRLKSGGKFYVKIAQWLLYAPFTQFLFICCTSIFGLYIFCTLRCVCEKGKYNSNVKLKLTPCGPFSKWKLTPENPLWTPCPRPPWPWFSCEKSLKIFKVLWKFITLTLTLKICILQENAFKELALVLFESLV